MTRWMRRRWRWLALLAGAPLALWLLAAAAGPTLTERSYMARILLWREADVDDSRRFPARTIRAAPPGFAWPTAPTWPDADPRLQSVTVERDGRPVERDLGEFLAATGTTAFLVIHDDRLIDERYFNGHDRGSTQTSFSVAKSFASALVGIAIAQGHIGSVDDPITNYIPELLERDPRFGQITIRHLITMQSGLAYEEHILPWRHADARTYYAPDLRTLALEGTRVEAPPGQHFRYNNYNPLLLGIILERATGKPVARFLEETLWQPLGMEADGSWSLDSSRSGFEKMESGINGRAIDFAKLGSLYLHGGEWQGRELIPRSWVEESTRVQADTPYAADYGYFWWVGRDGRFAAWGNHGQFIFVAPDERLVIARFGRRYGLPGEGESWLRIFDQLADRFR